MIIVGIILFVTAVCAALSRTPSKLPAGLVIFYWGMSWCGQILSLPLALLAFTCFVLYDGVTAYVLMMSAVIFGLAHLRNRRAGQQLLAAVGLERLRLPFHVGLVPFAVGRNRVIRFRNLYYGPAGKRNQLDLLHQQNRSPAPMPIVIHIHGGGWISGAKGQQGQPLLHHLCMNGWLGVDVNYRLGPVHRCPEMLSDVLRAIAWVRAHAHEYGGDPRRIVLTGGSAGGHLAAAAALAHDDPTLKPGFEGADCSVAACIPLYGRYDFLDRRHRLGRNHDAVIGGFMTNKVMPGSPSECPDLWRAMSPLDRVRPDAPPMLILHGNADTLLPHSDAHDFADRLRSVSRSPTSYVELPKIQHAWDMGMSALTWAHVRAIAKFLTPIVTSTD